MQLNLNVLLFVYFYRLAKKMEHGFKSMLTDGVFTCYMKLYKLFALSTANLLY